MQTTRKAVAGILAVCLGAVALSMADPQPVSAHGNIWMDENQGIKGKDWIPVTKYKQVVLFPLRYLNRPDGKVNEFQGYNNILFQRINKRIKRTNFLRFDDESNAKVMDAKLEKLYITRKKGLDKLLVHFPTEQARAKAVYDVTGAQGYLLPHIRWEKERIDTSPATWTRVKMETYYDIENGPNGDKSKCGYRSWYVNHQIPSHSQKLQMLDMDFTLYDAVTGKKTMTLIDYYRNYDVDQMHAFEQIAKNFTGDWNRLKKDHDNDVPANAPTLGFQNLQIPSNINEFDVKTIFYAYKDEAGDTLKNVRVNYQPGQGQYIVRGIIRSYDRGETWNPPYAITYTTSYKTTEFKWKDSKGNEHTGKYRYYKTDISDNYGYYSFWYRAKAHLELVNARTGNVVLSRDLSGEDKDRYANAIRSIFHDFYKDVDRVIDLKKSEGRVISAPTKDEVRRSVSSLGID